MQAKKYCKTYEIKTYEGDTDSSLRIPTLFNIFQDAADESATSLGLGMEFCLQKGKAWIGSNYYVDIKRLPKIHEKIRIETWPSEQKLLTATRDFRIFDTNENEIISASSQWILIDFARKRPLSLKDNLPSYTLIEERAVDTDFPKITEPQNISIRKTFGVRFDDIDINRHVNNAVYPLWASEAVENDFRLKNEPSHIEIAFKKECHLGEEVEVLTQKDDQQTTSCIKSLSDGRELALVKILWQSI